MSEKEVTEVQEYTGNYIPELPNANGARFDNINQGTVAVESSRAIAEAQGKLIIAKRFPRDEVQAYAKDRKWQVLRFTVSQEDRGTL